MNNYHSKLNKRRFINSVYIKKVEEVQKIKLTTKSPQYLLIFDTHNTNIEINNIVYSKKYMALNLKVDKMINIIDEYMNKYCNKINRCCDLECIELYYTLVDYGTELKEMKALEQERIKKKETGTKLNIKSIGTKVSTYLAILDMVDFDKLYDCKGITYEFQVNERLPKKYACKLYTDEEIQDNLIFNNDKLKSLNDIFFNKYLDKTGINLNVDIKQKEFIIDIHKIIEMLSFALNDYFIYKDKTTLNITEVNLKNFLKTNISFVEDITYITLFKKLNIILEEIVDNKIDNAYKKIKHIINNDDMNIYERVS